MREILFKAKRTDNGEWAEAGSIIQFLDNGVRSFYMPQLNEKCICTHDNVTDDILEIKNCRIYKVDPETVCQYTGENDINDNKIYENDVVAITWHDIKEDKRIKRIVARVIFEDGSFRFDLGRYGHVPIGDRYFTYALYERVGSYIDNPDLLEVEE